MKKGMFAVAMVMTLALAAGTVSAAALPGSKTADAVSGATQKAPAADTAVQPTKAFTEQELAAYDGKNGNKAYVAIDGTVYDVTELFQNGQHHGAQAGQDLTEAFEDEHSSERLGGAAVVGTLPGGASADKSPLTEQEQKRLEELLQEEQTLEQKEDALEAEYRSGAITQQDYMEREAALEAQEDGMEPELDALEDRTGYDDNDDQDDHDDNDDDQDDHDDPADQDDHDDDQDDHDDPADQDDHDDDQDDRDDD